METSPHTITNLPISDKLIYEVDPKFPAEMLNAMLSSVQTEVKQGIMQEAAVNSLDGERGVVNVDVRKSKVAFLCWDHWIAGILHNLFISANNDYFHFDLDHFDTGIQTTFYTEGDHYTWHSDGIPFPNRERDVYERKLSMSFMLTDDYKGGELEFELKPTKIVRKPKAGTAIIFPSWLAHRVKPVKEGERISLVAWMNGPKFK